MKARDGRVATRPYSGGGRRVSMAVGGDEGTGDHKGRPYMEGPPAPSRVTRRSAAREVEVEVHYPTLPQTRGLAVRRLALRLHLGE